MKVADLQQQLDKANSRIQEANRQIKLLQAELAKKDAQIAQLLAKQTKKNCNQL